MLNIQKLRADHVLDYAAEELKKYLRMMMPECGDIDITYNDGKAAMAPNYTGSHAFFTTTN